MNSIIKYSFKITFLTLIFSKSLAFAGCEDLALYENRELCKNIREAFSKGSTKALSSLKSIQKSSCDALSTEFARHECNLTNSALTGALSFVTLRVGAVNASRFWGAPLVLASIANIAYEGAGLMRQFPYASDHIAAHSDPFPYNLEFKTKEEYMKDHREVGTSLNYYLKKHVFNGNKKSIETKQTLRTPADSTAQQKAEPSSKGK